MKSLIPIEKSLTESYAFFRRDLHLFKLWSVTYPSSIHAVMKALSFPLLYGMMSRLVSEA